MNCFSATTFGRIVFLLVILFSSPLIAQNQGLKTLKGIKDPDSAMVYADKIAAEAQQKNDKELEARIRYQQSKIIYRTGDIVKAEDYARQALKLTTPADSNTYANSSTMIAYMLSQQGKDVEALNIAFKILRETDAHGWKKLNVYSLACIADLYRNIKNISKALIYAEQALTGSKRLNDTAQYIFTLSTLSNLYSDKTVRNDTNMKKAVEYMNIILNRPYVDKLTLFDKARYLCNMGRLYVLENDARAKEVLEQSLAISRSSKFEKLERAALIELTTLSVNNKNYSEAVKYGEKALTVNANNSPVSAQRNLYQNLTDAYQGAGDYKKALNYFQKERALADSLFAVDKARNADELDKKYQNDKRLLLAGSQTKLAQQQRNFIIALAGILLTALIAIYRWLTYKRKREAQLLAQEHLQLERLDAIKTRFFANISHELRTPITLIMGPADQLLNKQVDDEEQAHNYLLTIKRNSKKLLNIVNELLDLGKLEAGKLTIRPKPVAPAKAIKVIYQAFSSAAEFKNIDYKLICDIDEQLVAQLDQERFEKISNNLIGNAIKFTPNGGTIIVSACTQSGQITLNVSNTGMGIHPDDLPHIFDRYYQGHRHEQSLEGGTGIGLAIAREFAELMGGQLTVKNNWGHGSTFNVTIPLVKAAPLPINVSAETDSVSTDNNNTKRLVMIVEDNSEMADYISSILQPSHDIIRAVNGVEALNLLRNTTQLPSLIISDVMMPEMDGFTLLENLKQDTLLCTIPVIMLTALADNQHKLKALNIGVDDYLIKPFLNSELIARADNLINNAEARNRVAKTDHNESIAIDTDISADVEETEEHHPASPADLVWLTELEALIRKHTGKTDLNLNMLSLAMAISERQLFRRIKNITGLTPNKYIRTIRLQIAREAIESGRYRTIAEVSYVAGFDTPAYFSKLFKEHYGRDVNELL